ncbi:MAG: ABC transporter permease [Dehalococcoidia bacterium]
MSNVRMVLRQLRYENVALRRNTAAAFFTFIFPLMFLVIFTLVFGNDDITGPGGRTTTAATFYTGAIAAFSIVNACYTTLAMNVAISRDRGQLKRIRGTPLPPWAFITAKILNTVLVAVLLVVIVTVFGWLFYDVSVPTNTLPGLVLALVVGAAAFAALGLAITGFVRNEDAAPAIVNATILPLLFISDVFIPLDSAPGWLGTVASIFPVRPLAESMHTAFNPFTEGAAVDVRNLLVMAAWGAVGVVASMRFFRWEPRR